MKGKIFLLTIAVTLAACTEHCLDKSDKSNVGRTSLGTSTAVNPISIREDGRPKLKYEKIYVQSDNERLVMAGPDEFIVQVSKFANVKKSEDKDDNGVVRPFHFRSKDGVVIIHLTPKEIKAMKKDVEIGFRYRIILGDKIIPPSSPSQDDISSDHEASNDTILYAQASGDTTAGVLGDNGGPPVSDDGIICIKSCPPQVPVWGGDER